MKKKILLFLAFAFIIVGVMINPIDRMQVSASFDTQINYKSAVLIEKNSGKILFDSNAHERLPIASVTKLMTVLLTLEHVKSGDISLDDKVRISTNANGMGGSQIFLDANDEYRLDELLKSVIVASANDSSVALAEHVAGSENNFVRMMNERARELNMVDTNYANCTGLPTTDGYSSAYDQAILLSKVLNYDEYHKFSSIWNEDFAHPSGRTTQMTNTNKLSRHYEGCIGGKTGSTNQAKFCLAVGAKRNDMELISVVLGVENSKDRFKLASDLLNYGFGAFESKTIFSSSDLENKTIKIKGMDRETHLTCDRNYTIVTEHGKEVNYSINYNLPHMLTSVQAGQIIGNVEIVVDGVVVDCIDIKSTETHNEASIWDYFKEITLS